MDLNISKIVLVTLLAVAMASLSFGQRTDATFAGVVTDPSGAVLPGAEIQLINEGTAAAMQQVTRETGEFVFNFVPVGTYTLKIAMPGFRSYESRGIPLSGAQNVRRTYALEVGAITDSVTVTGEAPLVNTLSPEQRMSLETIEVKNLRIDAGSGDDRFHRRHAALRVSPKLFVRSESVADTIGAEADANAVHPFIGLHLVAPPVKLVALG